MAGVKGRSGRRPHFQEKTINEILDLATSTIKMALKDLTLPLQFRAELASKIFTKAMPQKVDATVETNVIEMPTLSLSDNRVETFIVGTPINGESV